MKKPSKIENIISKAKECIAQGLYRYTSHAKDMKLDRMITEEDALFIIETGRRVPVRDVYSDLYKGGLMRLKERLYRTIC